MSSQAADVNSISAELRDAAFVKQTNPIVAARSEAYTTRSISAAETTRAALLDSPELKTMREAARAIVPVTREMHAEIAKISRDVNYTPSGKHTQIAAAQQRYLERTGVGFDVMSKQLTRIRGEGDGPHFKVMRPDRATADVALVYAQAGYAPRSYLMKQAMASLESASSPRTPADWKLKENFVIRDAWLPVMERTSTSPERWAKHLAPLAGDMASLLQLHLDDVLEVPQWTARAGFADQLAQEVHVLRSLMDDRRTDDFILKLGASLLLA